MPRTKQVHPKNLRDKIEEAQKELNNPEESPKDTEVIEAGNTGALDTVKGVKRKKIVTGNYMKKIPKSPLRNPSRTKLRHCLKEPSSPYSHPNTSECSKNLNDLAVQNGDHHAEQNGKESKTELTVGTVKSGTPVQAKRVLLLHQSLKFCKGGNCDAGSKMTLQEKCVSTLSNKNKTASSGIFVDDKNSSSCTSTAFDVLLKVMEPELNTLRKKCPPCGVQVEKQRPNETLGPSYNFTSSTKSVQNNTSFSQQEFAVGPQNFPCTDHNVQVSTLARREQAHSHSACHSYSHQEQSVPHTRHQNQQIALSPSIRSRVHQQYPDTSKIQQIYNICVTSSIISTASSNLTQVLPQNQLTANISPNVSISSTNTMQLPPPPMYNITHAASLINQGGEQMCNLLLKDQKPKKQGKYICEYCNRACAKPSVLLKHIRSHTGERPYPCVTCGFSFKTKSNLYKHKKSHAHAIKLGLVLRPHSGDQESEKSLCIHCDADESGESDDEYTSEERQDEQSFLESETLKNLNIPLSESALQKLSSISSGHIDSIICDSSLQETCSELTMSTLPQVVVYPVNVPSLKDDSPKMIDSASEHDIVQKQGDFNVSNEKSNLTSMISLKEADLKYHPKEEMTQLKEKQGDHVITVHAQLQRQQATDYSQDQQGKYLLSPRSLGSTDSGYFSRSESAEQTLCQQASFVKVLSMCEKDFGKNTVSVSETSTAIASVVHAICAEKSLIPSGIMRPPLGTKTLEERISKLISDNEAVVDDKQLDSVKPRRISLSRRGSIDSPKSYIFKDSFQFDLKPLSRRTSSSSDIPKSPFTPIDKSKQVFLLSVPSLDCLPITRSNSMPTTGYSVVPTNTIPPHTLRESQSFDDKIGSFYDDVFVSTQTASLHHVGHPRTLVRQTAIEDSPSNDRHSLGSAHSVDESYHGGNAFTEVSLPRSKSFAQGSTSEKMKRLPQGRGTMFECETCRNRYRKLENFENHKKFYCSELHGPKTKAAAREPDHNVVLNSTQHQVLHYRVAGSTGVLEQSPQIRKRRKMKSVGDDDEPQQNENCVFSENVAGAQIQNVLGSAANLSNHNVSKLNPQQTGGIPLQSSQIELVSRGTEVDSGHSTELKLPPILEKINSVAQEKEMKRQGSEISVIQHTNSLSRPNSFEKSESFERKSPVSFQDIHKISKPQPLNTAGVIQEEEHSQCRQTVRPEESHLEVKEIQTVVSNERSGPVHQSRLVRQHNIQVPEILVTVEPDRDLENQGNDQEIAERFNWPQRSESLSNLPTEKLPPKKKRIRLAEIEHSSAESSFDSTISRSLSQESSLSRASSISALFDKDEISKTESISYVDSIIKSSEFLMIPSSSNSLGMSREMRRAASEQINCTHPSMEIADCRSKSLDCGGMSPTDCMSTSDVLTPKPTLCTEISGHVPLLERRRGPFVRQISLNIVPENNRKINSACLFKNTHISDLSSLPFPRLKTSCRSSDGLLSSSQHLPMYSSTLLDSQLVTHSSNLSSVEQPSCSSLINLCQELQSHCNSKTFVKVLAQGEEQDKSSITSEKENYFTPKYQLQIKSLQSQSYSSNELISTSPTRTLLDQNSMEQNSASLNIPTQLIHNVPGLHTEPQFKNKLHSNSSGQIQQITPFVVPVHGFPGVKTLPQILVTQDQINQPVSKVNNAPVSISKDKIQIQKSNDKNQMAMPTPEKTVVSENMFPETESRHSEPLDFIQKVPLGGLLPQQEASASSKRMLSPANSLDIAMEKHQKRVKDESGAACTDDVQAEHLLNIKAGEPNKQKKHVLVRQLCTTEPVESLDQDIVPEFGKNCKVIGESLKPAVPQSIIRASESENIKPFASTVIKSPEPQPLNAQTSLLKASSTNQEQRSPVYANLNKQSNVQGQIKLGPSLSVVNAGDMQRLSFPSLKTSTSFTWCYLLKRRPLHMLQTDQKISAYSAWTVNAPYPNLLGLPTKVALSLLNSKQKDENYLYTHAISTRSRYDILVYSSKWKITNKLLVNQKSKGDLDKENSETNTEQDKDNFLTKTEPRRVKIFDGGYKSNEDYIYVRGRGRGKYICEECGIRCKKPSMLKKHIRTHTDVRPYHCNYCNFSFKTKGNLTKHMKSKAHGKKCLDMGISVGLTDEQDKEEAVERQKYSCERPGYDVEDSDGADDDDNEDDDEDSQAESGLSATPSVTASPQHHPDRSSHHEPFSASEETRIADCFSRGQAGLVNILPKALLTKMTALTTSSDFRTARSPVAGRHQETNVNSVLQHAADVDCTQSSPASSKSPSYQMSVDYPDIEVLEGSRTSETTLLTKDSSAKLPSPPVDHSTQTTTVSDYKIHQEKILKATEIAVPQTHLFSHLPLHSQQPARTPYSMIPVGGVQLVPTYSTFVPIQAGPVQLTIPAVSVFHRPTGGPSDNASGVCSSTNPIGIAEVNSVVPCIPVGQVSVPGLPNLSAPSLQPLPSLSMETLNLLGLTNTNVASPIHPSGLTLNAVGLQVLTASPSQSNPVPQTHIPGLQILNIALPTLIPSISPLSTEGQGKKACETQQEQMPVSLPISHFNRTSRTGSSQVTPPLQEYNGKRISHPDTLHDYKRLNAQEKTNLEEVDHVDRMKPQSNINSVLCKAVCSSEPFLKVTSGSVPGPQVHETRSAETQVQRLGLPRKQNTVQFSDDSSDDDEDRLVIAT
uniref:Zinc finger protein 40 n=1 Tax=Geotrypetes seraphini TaxID=260995 RepID=A0A6P8QSL4_GEOSA|nr:zinc finger protein 40 isoform X2 [Geotrypetes seraphini]